MRRRVLPALIALAFLMLLNAPLVVGQEAVPADCANYEHANPIARQALPDPTRRPEDPPPFCTPTPSPLSTPIDPNAPTPTPAPQPPPPEPEPRPGPGH